MSQLNITISYPSALVGIGRINSCSSRSQFNLASVGMSVLRKNTLVVDFSVLPKRPDAGQVEKFLEEKVKLKIEDSKNIQLHNLPNRVYIEAIDSETALRYEKANYNKHSIVCNKKKFWIPVYVESEAVAVRVHDLPPHTQHQTIIDFMQHYGIVTSINRERWKHHFAGVYNGVRVLRMVLSRPISSRVTIDGEATLVTYPNQPRTCNHCGKAPHPKRKCETTPISGSENKTPPQAAATEADGQLDEEMFPPLPAASTGKESNTELGSPSITTHEQTEQDRTENKNENNTTSVDDDDDDGNNSSDTNGFMEANQKRRMLRGVRSRELATKKFCFSQGSQQNVDQYGNRFQALVEVEALCPSLEEVEEYLIRSKCITQLRNSSS